MRINMQAELRPCLVRGKKCLFHTWGERSVRNSSGKYMNETCGIVESELGCVFAAKPSEIRFMDDMLSKYYFPSAQEYNKAHANSYKNACDMQQFIDECQKEAKR